MSRCRQRLIREVSVLLAFIFLTHREEEEKEHSVRGGHCQTGWRQDGVVNKRMESLRKDALNVFSTMMLFDLKCTGAFLLPMLDLHCGHPARAN